MVEEKSCVICGVDVSKRPRVKDSRGRYACKECATRYGAKMSASDLGDTAVEGTAINETPAQFTKPVQNKCVKCKAVMPQDELTCAACGYNAAIGEIVENVAVKEWVERPLFGLKILEGLPRPHMGPGRQFIAWLLLFGGLFSLGTTNHKTFYIYAAATAIFLVVMYFRTIMLAFAEKRPGWATCGAVGIVFLPLGLSMPIYGLFLTKKKPIRSAWAALLFALFGAGVLYVFMFSGSHAIPENAKSAAPIKAKP